MMGGEFVCSDSLGSAYTNDEHVLELTSRLMAAPGEQVRGLRAVRAPGPAPVQSRLFMPRHVFAALLSLARELTPGEPSNFMRHLSAPSLAQALPGTLAEQCGARKRKRLDEQQVRKGHKQPKPQRCRERKTGKPQSAARLALLRLCSLRCSPASHPAAMI